MTWVISFISVLTIYLYGEKTLAGPIIGFFSQSLWYWLIWQKKLWGLIPCTLGFGLVHAWNFCKWAQWIK